MAISPACTVNSSVPPVTVATSSTPTIALASTAGVRYWSIQAVGADDLTSLSTINASLSVSGFSATFTAPSSAGRCIIFESIVGISGVGLDADGVSQPSYTTTFKVNLPTATHALHVMATNETLEDNTAGWVAIVNAIARLVG